MCGFVAIVSKGRFADRNLVKQNVMRMTNNLLHRGPDAQNFYLNEWVSLGFNRLSIIDPRKRSNQPMIDKSGKYVIVHNGEMYNYLENRKELTALGYSFRTNSDTEVVLNSFVEWQEQCVSRFQGMFSFMIVALTEKNFLPSEIPLG